MAAANMARGHDFLNMEVPALTVELAGGGRLRMTSGEDRWAAGAFQRNFNPAMRQSWRRLEHV